MGFPEPARCPIWLRASLSLFACRLRPDLIHTAHYYELCSPQRRALARASSGPLVSSSSTRALAGRALARRSRMECSARGRAAAVPCPRAAPTARLAASRWSALEAGRKLSHELSAASPSVLRSPRPFLAVGPRALLLMMSPSGRSTDHPNPRPGSTRSSSARICFEKTPHHHPVLVFDHSVYEPSLARSARTVAGLAANPGPCAVRGSRLSTLLSARTGLSTARRGPSTTKNRIYLSPQDAPAACSGSVHMIAFPASWSR